MSDLATIRAVAASLRARGVPPAVAEDAACEAWTRAFARGSSLARRPLLLAARRLATVGRGGASRAVAGLAEGAGVGCGGDEGSGVGQVGALDDAIDLASHAGRSPAHAVACLRAAGISLSEVGIACGVSAETARLWALGRATPRGVKRAALYSVLFDLASCQTSTAARRAC